MVNSTAIEKFIDRLGMTISLTPIKHGENLAIEVKVRYKGKLQYWIQDYYLVKDGKVDWYDSNMDTAVKDGVFSYLGDDDAVDNYFLDRTHEFAQMVVDADKNG